VDAAKWVHDNTIIKTVAGSRLYGTQRKDSDWDFRGVCLDPPWAILGIQGFEQYQDPRDGTDIVIYGVSKFLKMCMVANPSILDVLFAPEDSWVLCDKELWSLIYDNRLSFLSQKVRHTFSGYAFSQLKRIERHKRWIDDPPKNVTPEMFGLYLYSTPNGGQRFEPMPVMYNFVLDKWPFIDFRNVRSAIKRRSIYKPQDRTAMIAAYKGARAEYDKYIAWVRSRNPHRADLEALYGYDVKHASHLARLLMKGFETLSVGDYNPVLMDNQLKRFSMIMHGGIDYDDLVSWAKRMDKVIKEMPSVLPNKPDRTVYEDLITKFSAISLSRYDKFMSHLKEG